MKLKPLDCCFDKFLVYLSLKIPIYSMESEEEISQTEISRTAFGRVHIALMNGYYGIEEKDEL